MRSDTHFLSFWGYVGCSRSEVAVARPFRGQEAISSIPDIAKRSRPSDSSWGSFPSVPSSLTPIPSDFSIPSLPSVEENNPYGGEQVEGEVTQPIQRHPAAEENPPSDVPIQEGASDPSG